MALGTNDVDNLLIGSNGAVFSAPYGTALPTSEASSVALYDPVGYITPAGPQIDTKVTTKDIMSWQSFFPTLTRAVSLDGTVKFGVQEFTGETMSLAFGGGTLAEPTTGHYTFEPADPSQIEERSLIIDVHDGDDILRIVVERCFNVGGFSTSFTRENEAVLPIELKILKGDTYAQGVKFFTNIASFAATS